MTKTMTRLTIEAMIGLGLSIALFSLVIWLGYEEALTNGTPISVGGLEIYRFEDGTGVSHQNHMAIIGAVCMVLTIFIGELRAYAKQK